MKGLRIAYSPTLGFAKVDPEVAAVAPTEPPAELLPISERPARARGPAGGAA